MIRFLIEKEFKQIRRNRVLPRLIVAMPLLMMLVYPWAANQEVRDVRLAVVDGDNSAASRRLVEKLPASGYFKLADVAPTFTRAMRSVESGRADIVLEIAPGFERDMVSGGAGRVMIAANAVNGTRGMLGTSYLSSIFADYSAELRAGRGGGAGLSSAAGASGDTEAAANGTVALSAPQVPVFSVEPRYRFNPRLDYKVFMVPALMGMLMTLLFGFLPALNIVGEKETGTIEQINVTPVRKLDFVLAKLIPYWVVGFAALGFCMVLALAIYGIAPAGNIATFLLFSGVYILVVSGMGLVVSNYSETMQQAMFVMFFFIMILILMSGLFTPVSGMPAWARAIATLNPLKYFNEVMRLIYLKGSGFRQLIPQFAALCAFAALFNAWAVASYRKSS